MSASKGISDSLEITRIFPAPPQRIFRAWTDPAELRKWWKVGDGMTLTVAELDLRVGGEFRIGVESREGNVHMVRGRFLEVIPPERLVYTWIVDDPNLEKMETLVTADFRESESGTKVTIKHERLSNAKLSESVQLGWSSVLDGLTSMITGNT